ncbi:MAG TPA: hypothetical protein VHN11_14065 [Xanthobacteraceae bacterium]|jgi:hypothetical protein|nr:hypothetical protein [Xanthobacteraceae bacterium]
MRLKISAAAIPAIAFAIAALLVAASPSEAATKKKKVTASGEVRTRVLVSRRSYLDAGTEVKPGTTRKYTDYAFPPGSSSSIDMYHRAGEWPTFNNYSLPDPFWLPGSGRGW